MFGTPAPPAAFGSTAAPAFGAAPAPPTFSFGGSTPAPAAPAFGAAPAPAFGAATAPAFGAAPAPAFGAAPAPAFGAAPAPAFGAPATGAFGAPPAPAFGAPATGAFGSSFGSPAPSAFGGGFGSTPAPFGGAPAASTLQQPAQAAAISGGTPYSALPPDIRQAIDTIHEAIMKHRRTMVNLQSMAPKALIPEDSSRVSSLTTGKPAPLTVTIRHLHQSIAALEQETGLEKAADSFRGDYETLIKQAVIYGQWQIEALAVRRGVHLRPIANDKKQQQSTQKDGAGNAGQPSAQAQLQAVLDRQMAHVDRLERMPSPYLWQVLEDLQKRLQNLKHYSWTVQQQIHNSLRSEEPADISAIVQSQHRALFKVSTRLATLHAQVEQLRQQYRFYEKGENVIEKAQYEEQQRERRVNDRIQMQYVKAAATSTQTPLAAAPTPGAFGGPAKTTTPATFAFGGSTGTPAGAPATSFGGFGAPSPAASSFGGFGSSTPAPATSFGGFGSTTPAPTPGAFGAVPAATTPAPSFGGLASSASSTPKSSKNKSRSKSRLGR